MISFLHTRKFVSLIFDYICKFCQFFLHLLLVTGQIEDLLPEVLNNFLTLSTIFSIFKLIL